MRKKAFLCAITMTAVMSFGSISYAEADDSTRINMSVVGTNGFADFEGDPGDYLNVRNGASTEDDVIGRMYNYSIARIEDADEYGWYKIKSGNIEGYVAAQYIATGKDAEKIAEKTGYTTVKVAVDVLNVRYYMDEAAKVETTVKKEDTLEVLKNYGNWLKIVTEDGIYGYVSAEYVYDLKTEYKTAISNDEAEQDFNVSRETLKFNNSTHDGASQGENSDVYAKEQEEQMAEDSITEVVQQPETTLQTPETEEQTRQQPSSQPETQTQPQSETQTQQETQPQTERADDGITDEERAYVQTLPKNVQDLFYAYKKAEKSADSAKASDLYNQYLAAVKALSSETQPSQPETQPETQPQTQPETQPQTQPETQAETQAETQPQTQSETQPETQAQAQSGYSDTDLMAAIIYCEAGNQPYEGKVAVGAVVMNRVRSAAFPGSIKEVLYQGGQFQPAGNLESVLSAGLVPSSCYSAAADAMAGNDPTSGCLYFNNHRGEGLHIGDHWFY